MVGGGRQVSRSPLSSSRVIVQSMSPLPMSHPQCKNQHLFKITPRCFGSKRFLIIPPWSHSHELSRWALIILDWVVVLLVVVGSGSWVDFSQNRLVPWMYHHREDKRLSTRSEKLLFRVGKQVRRHFLGVLKVRHDFKRTFPKGSNDHQSLGPVGQNTEKWENLCLTFYIMASVTW